MALVTSANRDDIWKEFISTRRQELRDELITEYAPLVRFVVGRLGIPQTSVLEAEDLYSYGIIGLINAVDRFDPSRGVRFEAFATARIRGAVIDHLRALNWLPRSAVARVRQIETALATLEQRLNRPATEREAAQELGVTLERYRQMLLEVGIVILSLDAPFGSLALDDEVTSLGDLLEDARSLDPAQQVEQHETSSLLNEAVEHLPERERLLLSLYYFEELTMKEISKVLNVSESRICQLHMQAILRLRAAMNGQQDASVATSEQKTGRRMITTATRKHVDRRG
jgi:RNA polymerase sigma factor for flagellar operon FliA